MSGIIDETRRIEGVRGFGPSQWGTFFFEFDDGARVFMDQERWEKVPEQNRRAVINGMRQYLAELAFMESSRDEFVMTIPVEGHSAKRRALVRVEEKGALAASLTDEERDIWCMAFTNEFVGTTHRGPRVELRIRALDDIWRVGASWREWAGMTLSLRVGAIQRIVNWLEDNGREWRENPPKLAHLHHGTRFELLEPLQGQEYARQEIDWKPGDWFKLAPGAADQKRLFQVHEVTQCGQFLRYVTYESKDDGRRMQLSKGSYEASRARRVPDPVLDGMRLGDVHGTLANFADGVFTHLEVTRENYFKWFTSKWPMFAMEVAWRGALVDRERRWELGIMVASSRAVVAGLETADLADGLEWARNEWIRLVQQSIPGVGSMPKDRCWNCGADVSGPDMRAGDHCQHVGTGDMPQMGRRLDLSSDFHDPAHEGWEKP